MTRERFTRLYRLVQLLHKGAQSREQLTTQLGLDVRGFYRDLDLLRQVGIGVTLKDSLYRLQDALDAALTRLPYPDPHLTLGEVRQLAKGRSRLHQTLQEQIDGLAK